VALEPDSLIRALREDVRSALPPVHQWHPRRVQDIGLRIARDGTWSHQGAPIKRSEMVRLFSSILRRDGDDYFLVTPAEKVRVEVDLAPFVAVRMERIVEGAEPALALQTSVGDVVVVDADHPLWVEEGDKGPLPFVRVRDRLNALLSRSVFYDLAESASSRVVDGREMAGIRSRGRFWTLGSLEE
jgi:hypothetical protein